MVTSDFRPEVEIRPFRACAMKNTQYNAYLWPNCRNSRVVQEIGVEEHDADVRFQTENFRFQWIPRGSGNIALSFMRHVSGHNYSNSSFINCGRGYGADTTFHRTYFQYLRKIPRCPHCTCAENSLDTPHKYNCWHCILQYCVYIQNAVESRSAK